MIDLCQFHERAAIESVLNYNQHTGEFLWRRRDSSLFAGGLPDAETCAKRWNARFSGKAALTADNGQGYRVGIIFRKQYMAHRVAWLIMTGSWPDGEIDHINGDRSDNRFVNLRVVSPTENMRNRKRPATNKSGAIGVRWVAKRNKWRADIKVDGKSKCLGYFPDFEMAVEARKSKAISLGFHPNHGRS